MNVKVERGQIWNSVDKNGYNHLILVLFPTPKRIVCCRIEKFLPKSLYSELEEIILYKDCDLKYPSVPDIAHLSSVTYDELKTLIGNVPTAIYRIIVSCVSDLLIGNIEFIKGKYTYIESYNKQFRSPSRKSIIEAMGEAPKDQKDVINMDECPDVLVLAPVEQEKSTEEDKTPAFTRSEKADISSKVSKEVNKQVRKLELAEIAPICSSTNEPLDGAINTLLAKYGNGYDLSFTGILDKVNFSSISKIKAATTNSRRKRTKKNHNIILNKDNIIYILTHTNIQASAKFGVDSNYISSIKRCVRVLLYGEKIIRKRINLVFPEKDEYTIEELTELNPGIDSITLKNAYFNRMKKSKSEVDYSARDPEFKYVFSYTRDDMSKDQSSLRSQDSVTIFNVDKIMYEAKDKLEDIIKSLKFSDISLSPDTLCSKYDIEPNTFIGRIFTVLAYKAFSKKTTPTDFTEDEILEICSSDSDYEKKTEIILKHYSSAAQAVKVAKRELRELCNLNTSKDLNACDNVLDLVRSIEAEDLVCIARPSDEFKENFIKRYNISMEQFNAVYNFVSVGRLKKRLIELVKGFTNAELYYLNSLGTMVPYSYLVSRFVSENNLTVSLSLSLKNSLKNFSEYFALILPHMKDGDITEEKMEQFKKFEIEYQNTKTGRAKDHIITFD